MTTTIYGLYGPWIDWNGGECPVSLYTRVEVKCRSGTVLGTGRAGDFEWDHIGSRGDITEYRTVIEQLDLDAAEELLLVFGYTVTPPEKPLTFEDVVPMTEAPPTDTEYWAVHPFSKTGAEPHRWGGNYLDQAVLRHRMAYLEREHALIAARHIFGLKGGEL